MTSSPPSSASYAVSVPPALGRPSGADCGSPAPGEIRPIKLFEAEQTVRLASLKASVLAAGAAVTGRATARDASGASLAPSPPSRSPLPTFGRAGQWPRSPAWRVGRGARIALMRRADFNRLCPASSAPLSTARNGPESGYPDCADRVRPRSRRAGRPHIQR